MSNNKSNLDASKDLKSLEVAVGDKAHPWRVCPIGKHYVKTHVLHTPPGKEHSKGRVVTRHAHCANNPSHKDMLSYDEIELIAKTYFLNLECRPKTKILTEFSRGDEFDQYVSGWVQYWNEIFKPVEPLDPNLVKALIASESSFKPEKNTPQRTPQKNKKIGHARGLMQITDSTLKMIGEHKGEVKDHFIHLTQIEVMEPSANICTGVRWLFTKKTTAAARLGHVATWDDAVAEYKGILKAISENKDPNHNADPYNEMPKFRSFYKRLLE
jgi:Transglycosylase SLT domain